MLTEGFQIPLWGRGLLNILTHTEFSFNLGNIYSFVQHNHKLMLPFLINANIVISPNQGQTKLSLVISVKVK